MLNVFKENFAKTLLVAGVIAACAGIPGTASALTCTDCHGNPPVDNASRVGGTTGQFPGSHVTHSGSGAGQYAYACTKCHVNNAAANHANGNIDMAVPINGNTGASYGKGASFAVSNAAFSGNTCSATYCHSKGTSVATGTISGTSPAWGGSTACNSCHGTESGTNGAPGYTTIRSNPTAAPTSTGWTNGTNALVEDSSYAVYTGTTAQPLVLTTFNMTAAGLTTGDTVTGITVALHGLNTTGLVNVALTKTGNTTVAGTAKTVTMPTTDGWVMVNTTPTDLWGTTWTPAEIQAANFGVIVKDNDTTASNIQIDCVKVIVHTAAAPKMNSHANHSSKGCEVCHNATTTTGTTITNAANHVTGSYNLSPVSGTTFTYTYNAVGSSCSTVSCHGTAVWGVSKLGCVGCHSVPITRTKGRAGVQLAAVSTEFGLAWGHKKSGRGAVTDADCIVCHLEGDSATGKGSATYHQDGNIDLRDPDVQGETPITNIAGTAFTFQRFTTSFVAGSRTSSATQETIANIVTQKFCLKCHDADGAKNTTARNATGTQYMPFGGVNLGATYTVANGAAQAGGLINVAGQLATTNSSRHPVLAPLNRDFPTAAKNNDPYKPTGTRGTSGTLSLGVVIHCFDCHNVVGTPLTTRTVAAHGNAVTLRGYPVATNATTGVPISGTTSPTSTTAATLCRICHIPGTSTNHGTGSAFSSGGSGAMSSFIPYGCNQCHGSSYNTAAVRPVRAMDVHGNNVLPTNATQITSTGRWAGTSTGTPAQVNARPYAFIRNTQIFPNHMPKKIGGSTYTPTCMGGSVSPCSRGTETYTAGGTF
ncbi:CxxxxCH/CxxCH domain c-type cytochrome [Geomonas paludis]|uniref:Cytochrome c n=1 Tax=Geomonas paludis TaxID=2740185 RepID=A0A6V8N2J3_9BACT|nr:CxxxxCH/CxxCH domain-containing protein [Geomonas paludis]GFO66097.1 hypothetical protein GMPD_40160 [Geomonas paludis]